MRRLHSILVVDDDFDERVLTEHALKINLSGQCNIHLVSSGEEAVRYMIGENEYVDRSKHPFPTLVITDLNMANGDGFDVLEFLQTNPEWSVVPRIVFSSSCDDDDVRTAFLLGASAFHVKPTSAQKFNACIRDILTYWASTEAPPVDPSGRLLVTNCRGRCGARYPQPKGGTAMKRPQRRTPAQP